MHILSTELPSHLKYHSLDHTIYVLDAAEIIAVKERISESDKFLLRVAVLYHDIGFIHTYKDHEAEGCKIASVHLPAFGFSKEEIAKICGMIMATKIPQTPHNLLEEIIADADLEYLGTEKFASIAHKLFEEIRLVNNGITIEEWNRIQVQFLTNHHYFTSYCKQYKAPQKALNLEELKNSLGK